MCVCEENLITADDSRMAFSGEGWITGLANMGLCAASLFSLSLSLSDG